MAERRMFHTAVVESDAFLDLSVGAQVLYFHLGMNADDDGFINSPKQIARKLRRPAKELQLLIDKGFLLDFDGIVVVKHWRVANNWKTDRVQEPRYPEIATKIFIRPDRTYTIHRSAGCKNLLQEKRKMVRKSGIQTESIRNPNGFHLDSQKKREEKKREEIKREEMKSEEKKVEEGAMVAPAADSLTYDDRQKEPVICLALDQVTELMSIMGLDEYCRYRLKLERFIREKNAVINDHYATILKWWQEDKGGAL